MGSTALITGGTGGLGVAVTEAFLKAGWRVVVPVFHDAGRDRLAPHERLVLHGGADLMDEGSVREVVTLAAEDGGAPLRAVANLVGGFAIGERVHATPIEEFEAQFRLNLRPTYLVCRAALPALMAAGGGAIACVSTRAALRPFSGAAGYIASKAAVLAFVDALATEYRDDGVRANAVLPSVIDTPANREAMPDADHDRWVAPAQIADVVRYLCSEEAGAVSGAHVPVYGRA
ncbi:MAG: SDR family oxidoreductase [Solirubrobacterales bacterium]|nr:SDR family oxidoreductase [Solirubrobacterales bacterium]